MLHGRTILDAARARRTPSRSSGWRRDQAARRGSAASPSAARSRRTAWGSV